MKALQRLDAPAALVTRDGLWTRLYVRGFSPKQAAELAERAIRLDVLLMFDFASGPRRYWTGRGPLTTGGFEWEGVPVTDPRRAYQQQAAVEFSAEGVAWLGERLQTAFDRHGKVPHDDLDKLDWPQLP